MRQARQMSGITLIDLVMTLAIIGILVVIAFPIYEDYIQTASDQLLHDKIAAVRLLQADRRSSLGAFAEGAWDPAGGITTLRDRLGWEPGTAAEFVTCSVECDVAGDNAGECARDSGYTVTIARVDALNEPVIERVEP